MALGMHDQTPHRHELIDGDQIRQAPGLALYVVTLAIELCSGAAVRWLAAYCAATLAGMLLALPIGTAALAWAAALGPLAWSLVALISPGRPSPAARRLGSRRPAAEESEALDDALAILRGCDRALTLPRSFVVRDDPRPTAAAIGSTVIVTRGLIESDSLACVVAHELGHVRSLDASLSEALGRLALWVEPAAASGGEVALDPSGERAHPPEGIAAHCAYRLARIAGGATSQFALRVPWAAYWRRREYAADRYAASLGQGEELARHLSEEELPFDRPATHGAFDLAVHPPVAHRIERLLAELASHAGER